MPRILIADDNALSLEFFVTVLRERGHDCMTAVDGQQALHFARHERFDLLLFDLDMPRLTGPEALRCLRADPAARSQGSAAIATSAEMDKAIKTELLQSGFSATLRKPTDILTLNQAIESVLTQTHATMLHESVADDATNRIPQRDDANDSLLDDAQALSACGDAGVVQALRTLFAAELDALPGELRHYAETGAITPLRERLHRLRASCGFCGASALNSACVALRDDDDPGSRTFGATLQHLIAIAARTRAALSTQKNVYL